MRWTRALKYKVLNGLVPVAELGLRGLGATIRKSTTGQERVEEFLSTNRGGIGAFLHCDIPVMALWGIEMARRGRPITILTSPSRDGQIFARLLRRLGLRTVQGSSSKRGVEGALALIHAVEEGHHVSFAVDGPRGPRGVVKPGVIWLSRRSGAPIYPLAVRLRPRLALPTWDRAEIPLPLARCELVVGEEWLPPTDLAEACRTLGEKLAALKGERA